MSEEYILCIDIGNTHTVLGIFNREKLKAHIRLNSGSYTTEDEIFVVFSNICKQQLIDTANISGAIISSVVPEVTPIFSKMVSKYLATEPLEVSHSLDLGLVILYEDPSQVGADRLCNAVAGFNKYGGPIVIVDFGTATTFDCVSSNQEYLGGIIMPGIETASIDLHRRAAKLPKVELTFPDKLIATNTVDSIRAGIMYSTVDAVDGILSRLQQEMGPSTKMISTGGLASVIVEKSKYLEIIEPFMVLEGLRLLYQRLSE